MAAAMQPDPVPTSTTSGRWPGSAGGSSCERPLRQRLRLGPRNQHARGKPDADVEKILPAADQLQRLARRPAVHDAAVAGGQAGIQRAIEAQHDVAPAAGQQIGQQPLGVDARCVDARRAQGRGGLVERGADGHQLAAFCKRSASSATASASISSSISPSSTSGSRCNVRPMR